MKRSSSDRSNRQGFHKKGRGAKRSSQHAGRVVYNSRGGPARRLADGRYVSWTLRELRALNNTVKPH